MKTYFMSDPHFNHENIMKYSKRLYFMTDEDRDAFEELGNKARMSDESIRRMNQGILDNINAVVEPGDQLFCLGDWCFSKRDTYVRDARWFRDQIKCKKVHLILGNHDDYSLCRNVNFAICKDTFTVKTEAGEFFLSHYPHVSWNRRHHGVMHLYGHVHGYYHQATPVASPDYWAAFDVGVDVESRYGVWSATELSERLYTKAQKSRIR